MTPYDDGDMMVMEKGIRIEKPDSVRIDVYTNPFVCIELNEQAAVSMLSYYSSADHACFACQVQNARQRWLNSSCHCVCATHVSLISIRLEVQNLLDTAHVDH